MKLILHLQNSTLPASKCIGGRSAVSDAKVRFDPMQRYVFNPMQKYDMIRCKGTVPDAKVRFDPMQRYVFDPMQRYCYLYIDPIRSYKQAQKIFLLFSEKQNGEAKPYPSPSTLLYCHFCSKSGHMYHYSFLPSTEEKTVGKNKRIALPFLI